jgi:hypothetical protein
MLACLGAANEPERRSRTAVSRRLSAEDVIRTAVWFSILIAKANQRLIGKQGNSLSCPGSAVAESDTLDDYTAVV